jgi:hypothetical protein
MLGPSSLTVLWLLGPVRGCTPHVEAACDGGAARLEYYPPFLPSYSQCQAETNTIKVITEIV